MVNQVQKEVLSVLNPQSWIAPFESAPLTPRLDGLEKKRIGIVGQTHEPMLFLKDIITDTLPEIGDVFILDGGTYSNRDGFTSKERKEIATTRPDAIIKGIAH